MQQSSVKLKDCYLFFSCFQPGLHIKDLQIQLDYFYLEMHPKGDKIKKVY